MARYHSTAACLRPPPSAQEVHNTETRASETPPHRGPISGWAEAGGAIGGSVTFWGAGRLVLSWLCDGDLEGILHDVLTRMQRLKFRASSAFMRGLCFRLRTGACRDDEGSKAVPMKAVYTLMGHLERVAPKEPESGHECDGVKTKVL